GVVTSYEYDVFGNRSAVITDGVRTEFLVDPFGLGNVVAEYDASGALTNSYLHGLGLAARIGANGATYFFDADAVGSVTGLTDQTGANVNSYGYSPFGSEIYEIETVPNNFEFNGTLGVSEESGQLNFMRAREYDDEIGRFLTEDPLWFSGDVG